MANFSDLPIFEVIFYLAKSFTRGFGKTEVSQRLTGPKSHLGQTKSLFTLTKPMLCII